MADSTFEQPADRITRGAVTDGWSYRPWQRLSIRWQILSAIILVSLVAAITAAILIVYNAKRATEVEVAAALELAERLVREVLEHPQGAGSEVLQLADIPLRIGNLRHVRILVTNADGGRAALLPMAASNAVVGDQVAVPRWFTSIVRVEDVRREMQVVSGGRHIGSVIIVGHASDEIGEVWQDTRSLGLVALVLGLIVLAILYLALGRVLHPLTNLANGLRELEKGQFRHRLSRPNVQELADITDRFNALANRLGAAKVDNEHLNHQLVTVQDDERRQVATELHDELGPCLFGIKANVASLERLAGSLPDNVAGQVRERTATIDEIADKIQTMNRSLLNKLRPMALNHLPLAEVITGLLAEFQRHGPTPKISLTVGRLADRYDDPVNITIHRCIQEGITNVLRHAEARSIDVALGEQPATSQQSEHPGQRTVLQLSIKDDGRGFALGTARGLGLTGMEERVRALVGNFSITNQPGGGTRLEISIPLNQQQCTRGQNGTRVGQP